MRKTLAKRTNRRRVFHKKGCQESLVASWKKIDINLLSKPIGVSRTINQSIVTKSAITLFKKQNITKRITVKFLELLQKKHGNKN